MKIVFLDVDGVLINIKCFSIGGGKRSGEHTQAHPDCVAALNHITDETGARIVVSSVWRLGGLHRIRDILRGWGVTGKVISCTPDLARRPKESKLYVSVERGAEIQAWLDSYKRSPVESFCIIDDDADMMHLSERLVQTEFNEGLTEAHAEKAIALLSPSP